MNNIILIGFMGAGKTSIGKIFSDKKNMGFIDTDNLIEEKAKMKISDIFKVHGENHFRKLETELLSELLNTGENKVISVGGGLPMEEENKIILKELGTIIYLEVSKDTILERIGQDTSRPLLMGQDRDERVSKLLKERSSTYKELADFIVTTDHKNFHEIIKEIEVGLDEDSSN